LKENDYEKIMFVIGHPADPNAPVTITVWCWDANCNMYSMNEAAKIDRRDHPN
jgi:hypothetical protein